MDKLWYVHNGILWYNANEQTPITSDHLSKYHKCNIEQKKPEQNNIWFSLYKVQKQAELIYCVRS